MTKSQQSRRLIGLKVLVTGATSGLGFSISVNLAKEGADLIAIGRNKNHLEGLSDAVEKTKGSVTLVCIDLAKQGTIEELSQKISEKFGQLNVIVHCAMSSLQMMPINQVSLKEFEINLLSPIAICFRLITCFHEILSGNPKGLFIYISDFRTKKFTYFPRCPTIDKIHRRIQNSVKCPKASERVRTYLVASEYVRIHLN